jgi:hypothetical protein
VALRGLLNERNEFLISTLPVTALAAPMGEAVVLPHFAAGGGWTTQIILVNPTDEILNGTVHFYDQGNAQVDGQPISLNVNGQLTSTSPYRLAPRSSSRLLVLGPSEATAAGSIRIIPSPDDRTPAGSCIFIFKRGGITVSEAGVVAVRPASAFRVFAESSGGFSAQEAGSSQSGVAVANPSASDASVTFELITMGGTSTGLTGTATIPGNGQIALFLSQISGFESLSQPFQGVLRISTTSPPGIAVVGLRTRYNERKDFLITTTPPVSEATASAGDIVFPHFVDGGGYTTQFVLLSRAAASGTGSLALTTQSGQPMTPAFSPKGLPSTREEPKVVRVVYLVPLDKTLRNEYATAIAGAVRNLQVWYRNGMGNGKTFLLNSPIIEVYRTSHTAAWYSTNPIGNDFQYWFWFNAVGEGLALTGGTFADPNNIWVFYLDADPRCGQIGGAGTTGVTALPANDLKGLTNQGNIPPCPDEPPDLPAICRWVGGLGHELGHALGLPHPRECEDGDAGTACPDSALLWLGFRTYPNALLLPGDREILNRSPFFVFQNLTDSLPNCSSLR